MDILNFRDASRLNLMLKELGFSQQDNDEASFIEDYLATISTKADIIHRYPDISLVLNGYNLYGEYLAIRIIYGKRIEVTHVFCYVVPKAVTVDENTSCIYYGKQIYIPLNNDKGPYNYSIEDFIRTIKKLFFAPDIVRTQKFFSNNGYSILFYRVRENMTNVLS